MEKYNSESFTERQTKFFQGKIDHPLDKKLAKLYAFKAIGDIKGFFSLCPVLSPSRLINLMQIDNLEKIKSATNKEEKEELEKQAQFLDWFSTAFSLFGIFSLVESGLQGLDALVTVMDSHSIDT